LKKGFLEFFRKADADIFCLQEIKMEQGQADIDLSGQQNLNLLDKADSPASAKYYEYWNSAEKKGYSGTAVFTKTLPLSHTYGMGIYEHDREGRMITLEYDGFYLVNVYTPNSQRELARLEYRMCWEDAFRHYVCQLDAKKTVIICGDLNVAHKEIDLKNPKSNVNNAGFTKEERDKMTGLLDSGFTDLYRHFYPQKENAYTWWSYMGGARERNTGWRIDYFLGSNRLTETVNEAAFIKDAFILPQVHGSDHCPVGIETRFG